MPSLDRKQATGSKAWVPDRDLEVPAERAVIIGVWEHETCRVAGIASAGFQDLRCEDASGFQISTPAGDQKMPKEWDLGTSVSETTTTTTAEVAGSQDSGCDAETDFKILPVDADALCMRVPNRAEVAGSQDSGCEAETDFKISTVDADVFCIQVPNRAEVAGSQDSGCEAETEFKISTVDADVFCIQVPNRAEAFGVGPASLLRSAWMWMLQKEDEHQTDGSGKHGLPICMSAITVIAGATISCALQYALLPNVNPLHHQDKRGWWYCPFNCTLIWMPISIVYIGTLLDQFVLAGTGVQLTYLDLSLLWLMGSITVNSLFTVFSWTPKRYPFPLVSTIAASCAFMSIAIVFGFCVYPRLRRAVSKHEARKVAVKSFLVFAMIMLSLSVCSLVLLWLPLLDGSGSDSLKVLYVLLVGLLREACRAGAEKIATLLSPEAAIIGQNTVMASFIVSFTMLVGNSSSVSVTGVIVLQDMLRGMIVGIMMGNVFIGQFNLSVFLLRLQPALWFKFCARRSSKLTENEIEQRKSTLKSNFIAFETGEVILPIACLCSWLAVRVGPYKSSFTAVGSGDYGIQPPEKISHFAIPTSVLIVFEALSAMILKLSLRYFLKVTVSFDEFYSKFGKVLTVQSIWVVHSSFCLKMVSCGVDYSLQWANAQE